MQEAVPMAEKLKIIPYQHGVVWKTLNLISDNQSEYLIVNDISDIINISQVEVSLESWQAIGAGRDKDLSPLRMIQIIKWT